MSVLVGLQPYPRSWLEIGTKKQGWKMWMLAEPPPVQNKGLHFFSLSTFWIFRMLLAGLTGYLQTHHGMILYEYYSICTEAGRRWEEYFRFPPKIVPFIAFRDREGILWDKNLNSNLRTTKVRNEIPTVERNGRFATQTSRAPHRRDFPTRWFWTVLYVKRDGFKPVFWRVL